MLLIVNCYIDRLADGFEKEKKRFSSEELFPFFPE